MDPLDEILALAQKRDSLRQNVKMPSTELPKKIQTSSVTKAVITGPKITQVKPQALTYEQLMKKAEENEKLKETIKAEVEPSKKLTFSAGEKRVDPRKMVFEKPPVKIASVPKLTSKPVSAAKIVKRTASHIQGDNLVVLNQKKRDLRTIEEIQQQLRHSKKPQEVPLELSERPRKSSITKNQPTRKKEVVEGDEDYYAKNYSSIISEMFGYDRRKFTQEPDSDLEDMESDYRRVVEEETRSAKIAKQEDVNEELAEMRRLKEKQERLNSIRK